MNTWQRGQAWLDDNLGTVGMVTVIVLGLLFCAVVMWWDSTRVKPNYNQQPPAQVSPSQQTTTPTIPSLGYGTPPPAGTGTVQQPEIVATSTTEGTTCCCACKKPQGKKLGNASKKPSGTKVIQTVKTPTHEKVEEKTVEQVASAPTVQQSVIVNVGQQPTTTATAVEQTANPFAGAVATTANCATEKCKSTLEVNTFKEEILPGRPCGIVVTKSDQTTVIGKLRIKNFSGKIQLAKVSNFTDKEVPSLVRLTPFDSPPSTTCDDYQALVKKHQREVMIEMGFPPDSVCAEG